MKGNALALTAFSAAFLIGCATGNGGDGSPAVGNGANGAPAADAASTNTVPSEVRRDGVLTGVALLDGRVLVNGNISGSAKYVLKDCPVEDGVRHEERAGANSALVKWVFPKAVELRVQIDYGFGFPEGTKVRVQPQNDNTLAAIVSAPDGEWYFFSEFSTPYSRPSLFADGKLFPWTGNCGELTGASPVGISWECFYGADGDDIQVKTAWSRKSVVDAAATLAAEQPGFLPMKRKVIWQYDESTFPARAAMKGDKKAPSLKYIQRTLRKMEESTAQNPATVRVLFYGQSIVWQFWSRLMMQDLQARYPTVNFIWKNLSIGGFEADKLRDSFRREVCAFYPDLLFFHDYGSTDYYAEMVKWAREDTAAEIVLWTSHLSVNDHETTEQLFEKPDARSVAILATAEKYHCHVIDLRRKWCRMLLDKGLDRKKFLADGIHLNGPGQMQYKEYIEEELIRLKGSKGDEAATGSEKFFAVGDKSVTVKADGTLEFSFDGNRVVAVSDGTADEKLNAQILLDGKPMSKMPELWTSSRPSPLIMWFPGLHSFSLGPKAPVEEDWTLEILPLRAGDPTNEVPHAVGELGRNSNLVPFRFKVTGSVTGDDGDGISTQPFTSKSGRLTIPVRAWALWPHWKSARPKPGSVTRWSVHPLFADRLKAAPAGAETLVVQGCANGKHTLAIRLPKGAASGIRGFRVWKPATAAAPSADGK